MWSRVTEILLGCWLIASPVVFGHAHDDSARWIMDVGVGGAVVLLAAASYWRRTQHAHLLLLLVACVLIGLAYSQFGDPPPAAQNRASVGLLLLMFALIPNRATQPPPSWADAGSPGRQESAG
jgi:uncharacterized membrane protein YdcZ (DUF606 family)